MTNREFDKLIAGTKMATYRGGTSPSLAAARLHFVEGNTSITECAKQAGCSRQNAQAAVTHIRELIEKKGMETVVVTIPKGKRRELARLVKGLQDEA
jgi:hypothetical protein